MYSELDTNVARVEQRLIVTDYPYKTSVRDFERSGAGKKIVRLLDDAQDDTKIWLGSIAENIECFRTVSENDVQSGEPYWKNPMLPPLDGMLLYTLVKTHKPRIYFEVGSGNSTKYVGRAIRDAQLKTRVISVDPEPRAEIDEICDEIMREPFENIDIERAAAMLSPGDIVYIDNSHRTFQNSDVTVFFTEFLPILPNGVIFGIHDIFLPLDYPPEWALRFYNEQYMLVTYLLAGADGDKVIFPGMHASRTNAAQISEIFNAIGIADMQKHSGAFWLVRNPNAR